MTPVLTALIGAIVVFAGALVARGATRYAAELDAAQRRRDAEIAHLAEFRSALIEALTSYATYKHVLNRIPADESEETTFEKAALALEDIGGYSRFRADTVLQIERVRILALGLMWHDLRAAFEPMNDLLAPRENLLATAISVDHNSRLIESFVTLVARRQRELIATYPCGRAG